VAGSGAIGREQKHKRPPRRDAAATPRHGGTSQVFYVMFPPPNVGMDMSGTYRIERDRGIKEYRQQLTALREKWPLAFPANVQDIRPLEVDATHEIAAIMGWSYPYTLGVLSRWKMAPYTARPCSASTNASPLTALRLEGWKPRRRT